MSGIQTTVNVMTFLCVAAILGHFLYAIVVPTLYNGQQQEIGTLRSGLAELGDNLTLVNETLTQDLLDLNASVAADFATLEDILNLTGASAGSVNARLTTLEGNVTDLRADLEAINGTIGGTDPVVLSRLDSVENAVDDRIQSINFVHGDNSTHNVNFLAGGPGITLTPNPMGHQMYVDTTAVLTLTSVPATTGNVQVVGAGMITVTPSIVTSTLTVDGSSLVTSITNLQSQNSMQQTDIMNLQSSITTLQNEIDAVQTAGQMVADALNGTTITFNMTLMDLITELQTAQNDIATLQAQVMSLSSSNIPAGSLQAWAGAMGGPYPTGWLYCDGTEYLTTDYPALYTAIGTMFCGPCTNASYFAVPDMRGRVPAGKGGTALNAAIGTAVGAETHALSTAELASHTHTGTSNLDGNHVHTWVVGITPSMGSTATPETTCFYHNTFNGPQCGFASDASRYFIYMGTDGTYDGMGGYYPGSPTYAPHQHAFTSDDAGSGSAHNNVQPSMVVQYIIKT